MERSIRRLCRGLAAAAALSAPAASAADWSGWVVGAHVGYGAGRDDVTEVDGPRATFADSDGALGGVQAARLWQAGRLVVGAELEAGHLGQSGSATRTDPAGTVASDVALGPYAALSGRAGWLLTPDWQAFARAGVAVAALDARTTQRCAAPGCALVPSSAPADDVTFGGVFGGGLEWALSARWRGRMEYQYVLFRKELALPDGDAGPGWRHDIDLHLVKLAVGFRL